MSYLAQAQLANHAETQLRMIACASRPGIPNPSGWVSSHPWQITAHPGLAEAYADAVESGEPVHHAITDSMLLEAIEKVRADEGENPPPVPPDATP